VVSAYLSDAAVLREIPAAPSVRLYSVRGGVGLARVVDQVRPLPGVAEAREVIRHEAAFDPRRQALLPGKEARGLPAGSIPGARARRAEVTRIEGGRLGVRAEGPGVLVVNATWNPGWRARVDDRAAPVLRVGEAQLGVLLGEGPHRVSLRFEPPGFLAGLVVAGLSAAGLLGSVLRAARARRGV
jgi:hypothetical protein